MCDLCVRDEEKTILLEIRNVHDNPEAKYEESIDALAKALGFDAQRAQKEVSPFKSVRDLERLSKDTVEKGLLKLYNTIVSSWIDIEKAAKDTYVLNGRIFLDPRSGKPLTNAQWAQIKKDVLKAFDYIYANEEERIALHAMSLGRVIKGLPLSKMVNATHASLTAKVEDTMKQIHSPEWARTAKFAQQNAAEHIVDLKQKQYKKIHDVIQTSIVNRENPGTLKAKLFDKFGEMNRDWRMIAETEIGNAQNHGQILTEMERTPEGEYTFMRGVSASEACPWCRNEVDQKVVVVLPEAPAGGDQVEVNGETYTAIWPGKSNVGRNRRNWWVAAGTQHPHCILPGQDVSASLMSSVTEGFYEGRVIEITTANGSKLAITENHPVLTPDGFVQAKFLTEGMNIVSGTNSERVVQSINPHYYQRPTEIQKLFRTAKHSFSRTSRVVPVSSKDFHGDGRGMNGNVDIVDTYGFLGSELETAFRQEFGHDPLTGIDLRSRLLSKSTFFKGLSRNSGATPRNIGLLHEFLSHLNWGTIHPDLLGLSSSSWDNASFEQALSEGSTRHSRFSREFLFRFSSLISLEDVSVQVAVRPNTSSLLVSDEITHINTSQYSGPVYDLSDDVYELYIVNGVVVKNCRCTWVGYKPGYDLMEKMYKEAIEQSRAGYTGKIKIPEPGTTEKPVPWKS